MGHYGSGKTFVAVNYALRLKELGKKISIYDLDVVNPYFRTVDAEKILKKAGINLVVSPYAETNVDIPAMNAQSYRMTDDREEYAVVDVGGDDRGALALGRFSEKLKIENNYDALFVLNKFRKTSVYRYRKQLQPRRRNGRKNDIGRIGICKRVFVANRLAGSLYGN